MCDSCSQASPSRRSLLLGGAAFAAIPLVGRAAQAQPVSAADTPDAALKLMTEGNERYVATSRANGISLLDARAERLVRLPLQQF